MSSPPSPTSRPYFLSLGFLFQIFHWRVVLGQLLTWNHPSSSFSLYFNLNKWFSHRSKFFSLWFHHLSVVVCCSSSCAALFDFPCVHLIHIEDRLFNQRFGRQRCRSEGHGYSGHFNFIIYFCRHYTLYAINLDVMSLFEVSSFTFLAVLNDVISRFEWMNIILFLSKKKTVCT